MNSFQLTVSKTFFSEHSGSINLQKCNIYLKTSLQLNIMENTISIIIIIIVIYHHSDFFSCFKALWINCAVCEVLYK